MTFRVKIECLELYLGHSSSLCLGNPGKQCSKPFKNVSKEINNNRIQCFYGFDINGNIFNAKSYP